MAQLTANQDLTLVDAAAGRFTAEIPNPYKAEIAKTILLMFSMGFSTWIITEAGEFLWTVTDGGKTRMRWKGYDLLRPCHH